MKTYEIKTSRSRWTSLVIAVLLIVMVAMMCMPYFNYGDVTSTFAPADGHGKHLTGTWVLSGTDPEEDGYKEIEFIDEKNFELRTTNIIRVYQDKVEEAVAAAANAVVEAEKAVDSTELAYRKVQEYEKKLAEAKAYIDGYTAADPSNTGLTFTYFASEISGLEVAAPEGAPMLLDDAAIKAIQDEAAKAYTRVQNKVKDARENYEESVAALEKAKAAHAMAVEAAAKANSADGSLVLVTEDKDTFIKYFAELNPELVASIVAKDQANYDAYTTANAKKVALDEEIAALKDKKAKIQADADAMVQELLDAKKAAEADAEAILKDMKKEFDAANKADKANVDVYGKNYIAAVEALNAEITKIVEEYKAAVAESAANDAIIVDANVYNKKIADLKEELLPKMAEAKAQYQNDVAANDKVLEDRKVAYNTDVENQTASNTEAIANATEAYNAEFAKMEVEIASKDNEAEKVIVNAKAEIEAIDAKVKALNAELKDVKKAVPSKKVTATMTEAQVAETVAKIAVANSISETELELLTADFETSKEELDNKVYEKLASEKAKAAEAYNTVKNVSKDADKIVKDAGKLTKESKGVEAAEKPVTDFVKEFDKYVAVIAKLNPEAKFDLPDVSGFMKKSEEAKKAEEAAIATAEEAAPVEEPAAEEAAAMPAKADKTIVTKGTYKFDGKNNKNDLTLKFQNGEEIKTKYSTLISYNGVQELSILGYVGFPYKVEDFGDEMDHKIFGFKINDVVLVPIVLLVLAVLGVVFCFLKKDKMSSAFLPAAFGIVGLIGYGVSDFLKLGEKYTNHMIGFAVVLVVAVLHIVFSVKEKKAK